MAKKQVKDLIEEKLFNLEKYKFLSSKYDDLNVSTYEEFTSKSVNKSYSNLEFHDSWSLYVRPYNVEIFEFNGKKEEIKIYSEPTKIRLAYRGWDRTVGKSVIRFNRVKLNMKNNNFDDKSMKEFQTAIMNYVGKYPKLKIDPKNLDKRLQKIMVFN